MRIEAGPHHYRIDGRTLNVDQPGLEIGVLRTLLAAMDKAGLQPADVMSASVQPDCVDLAVIAWSPSGQLLGQVRSIHVEV